MRKIDPTGQFRRDYKREATSQKPAEITAIPMPQRSPILADGAKGFTKAPGDVNASWKW